MTTSSRNVPMGQHPLGRLRAGAGDRAGGTALRTSVDRQTSAIHVELAELRDQAGRRVGLVRMVLANSAPTVVMYGGDPFVLDRQVLPSAPLVLVYRLARAYRADGLVDES